MVNLLEQNNKVYLGTISCEKFVKSGIALIHIFYIEIEHFHIFLYRSF
jgi:hypothetical protein